jgi:hypothetical protein
MGYDASCTIRVDGKTARGTAWLEHKDLVFRGPFRVAVPLGQITRATAKDGRLTVEFGGREAEFTIGAVAAKWADRIMNPPSRLDKLGVKPAMTVLAVSLDDRAFLDEVRARGATVVTRAKAGGADLVFYAANTRAALSRLAALAAQIVPDGAVWVIRPKGQRAITESDVMAAGKHAGLVDVKVVSFSETQTAEKFVIPVARRPKREAAAPPRPVARKTTPRRA